MVRLQVLKIDFIEKNAQQETINLVVLRLANGAIVRPAKAFLNDLKNSFVAGNLTNINSPSVRRAMRDMKGAFVSGDIKFNKAGDEWTVEATSSIVTDANHPKFGTVQVGDKLIYEKDFVRVEGFLDVEFPEAVYAREANAEALASMSAMAANVFDVAPVATNNAIPGANDDPSGAFDPNEVPQGAAEGLDANGQPI